MWTDAEKVLISMLIRLRRNPKNYQHRDKIPTALSKSKKIFTIITTAREHPVHNGL